MGAGTGVGDARARLFLMDRVVVVWKSFSGACGASANVVVLRE